MNLELEQREEANDSPFPFLSVLSREVFPSGANRLASSNDCRLKIDMKITNIPTSFFRRAAHAIRFLSPWTFRITIKSRKKSRIGGPGSKYFRKFRDFYLITKKVITSLFLVRFWWNFAWSFLIIIPHSTDNANILKIKIQTLRSQSTFVSVTNQLLKTHIPYFKYAQLK